MGEGAGRHNISNTDSGSEAEDSKLCVFRKGNVANILHPPWGGETAALASDHFL